MKDKSKQLKEIFDIAKNGSFPIIFCIPGSGQIARCATEGGAHFLMALNAGLYRNAGVTSLGTFMPYGNVNDQIESLLRNQIMPRKIKIPIVAGVMANDPITPQKFRFKRLKGLGIAGITNWPALGFIDGKYREILTREGFTVDTEIEMLAEAKHYGFATVGFSVSTKDAVAMAQSGVDALILSVGWTFETENTYEKSDRIQRSLVKINEMHQGVRSTGKDIVCLFFGGTITLPEDTATLYRMTNIHGYGGGSAFESFPVEKTVTNTVKQFCSVPRRTKDSSFEEGMGEMLGATPVMRKLYKLIENVAPHQFVNVCIQGESGVGKEIVAIQLHRLSDRSTQPFITLNCGAIPDTLIESEFFGHEKGSFTGALSTRIGKFELADGGTLFLDEVAELSPKAQVSLLRAIQQKEIFRVGGEKAISIDIRLIAATHRNLKELVQEGKFRADLYYRLNMITLNVPPLRMRAHDIPLLVKKFLDEYKKQFERELLGVTPEFMQRLMNYSWPGNVRELKHVLCQAILLQEGPIVHGQHVHFDTETSGSDSNIKDLITNIPIVRNEEENELINALNNAGGNKSKASKMLGISRKTLYSRLKKLGVE